jgi:hypothetical protein
MDRVETTMASYLAALTPPLPTRAADCKISDQGASLRN